MMQPKLISVYLIRHPGFRSARQWNQRLPAGARAHGHRGVNRGLRRPRHSRGQRMGGPATSFSPTQDRPLGAPGGRRGTARFYRYGGRTNRHHRPPDGVPVRWAVWRWFRIFRRPARTLIAVPGDAGTPDHRIIDVSVGACPWPPLTTTHPPLEVEEWNPPR